jgi:uncharacterized integral membrane protein
VAIFEEACYKKWVTLVFGMWTILMILVMKNHKPNKFHFTSATMDTKKILLYNESYLSMALHGLVIQVVLYHCASSVANNLQMQQWHDALALILNECAIPHTFATYSCEWLEITG